MDEIIKKLIADKVITEGTAEELRTLWATSLTEAKVEQEKSVRAEFSKQYDADMQSIQEAFEKYLQQEFAPHLKELHESTAQADAAKLKLVEERRTFRQKAQKVLEARLAAFDENVRKTVDGQLSELHESVTHCRRAYVNAINGKMAELEGERTKFRDRAAKILEHVIETKTKEMLHEMKDDIRKARQNDFGQEVFEAFAATFRSQFFNTEAEYRGLMEKIGKLEESQKALRRKSARALTEAQERIKAATLAHQKLEESVTRERTMQRLLGSVRGETRDRMKALLESAKTEELEKTFRKFLPDLQRTNAPKPLMESKRRNASTVEVVTGDRSKASEDAQNDSDIVEIRRLGGVKA